MAAEDEGDFHHEPHVHEVMRVGWGEDVLKEHVL